VFKSPQPQQAAKVMASLPEKERKYLHLNFISNQKNDEFNRKV
jgi:hypothetical protein